MAFDIAKNEKFWVVIFIYFVCLKGKQDSAS